MQKEAVIKINEIMNVTTVASYRRRSDILLFIVMFATTLGIIPLLVLGGVAVGWGLLLGLAGALVITILIIRWPLTGFYVIAACALMVEVQPLTTASILTDHLYIFYWPSNLAGQIERPIGYLFIFTILIFVCHRFIKRQWLLHGGGLFWPFLIYLLCIIGGVLHGLVSGGDFKIIVVEIRPFWYFFEAYLLAYNLVRRKRNLYAFFWLVILAAGVKGLQGVYIFLVVLHGRLPTDTSIMSHEESFFFVSLLLLLILLCLHYCYRPQLYAALLILPFDIISLVANERRTDYLALLMGLFMSLALVFVIKPQLRKMLIVSALIITIIGAGYLALFATSTGFLAVPARAIVSVFDPTAISSSRADSNLYRQIEDTDLLYTIKQSPLIGLGFGKPYYEPISLTTVFPQILANDMYYAYIPHNNIYWVWMRLGIIGFCAFWYLIGSAIIKGSLIARNLQDRYLQLIAIYIIGIIGIEIVVAFSDYQLFNFRNIIYVGLLLGILMRLSALDAEKEKQENLV